MKPASDYSSYSAEIRPAKKSSWILLMVGLVLGFVAACFWIVKARPEFVITFGQSAEINELKNQLTTITLENFDLQKKLALAEGQPWPAPFTLNADAERPRPADAKTTPAAVATWREIKRFTGQDGKTQTATFILDGQDTRFTILPGTHVKPGNYLGVILKQPPQHYVKLLYNQANDDMNGPEEVSFSETGEFYLDVNSMRTDWEIVVESKK